MGEQSGRAYSEIFAAETSLEQDTLVELSLQEG